MNRIRKLAGALVAVLLLGAVLLGGLYVLTESVYEDSYESNYEYDVRVTTNGTLTNATMLVPAPVLEGEATVDAEIEAGEHYANPDAVSSRIVETEHGPMLEVTVDEFVVEPEYYRFVEEGDVGWTEEIDAEAYDPDDPDMFVRDREQYELHLRIESDDEIDTREPVGTEPLLEPRFDAIERTCPGEIRRCETYASQVYLEYEAGASTAVSTTVTVRGENTWWVGGWNGNWYEDRVTAEAVGPQTGWVTANGDLEAGHGSYR